MVSIEGSNVRFEVASTVWSASHWANPAMVAKQRARLVNKCFMNLKGLIGLM
jgi:hypothetical protein